MNRTSRLGLATLIAALMGSLLLDLTPNPATLQQRALAQPFLAACLVLGALWWASSAKDQS